MAEYNLGTARGKIDLDATGAVKGVTEATAATQSLEASTKKSGASIGAVGLGLAGFGIAALGAFGIAVNAAASFEKKLSEFKAVSGATADQIDAISEKALQLGADTSFSAGEAAEAMNELAKSGLGVDAILNGAADAVTYLAAAGSVELPEAASIISAAMNQFKLDAAELPRVADLIAGAANASATGVNEVGLALEYVGPVAKAAGLSIDDTTAAIALLANNGIDAQKAGTGLRGILSSLQPSSDKAATAMKELGLITADGSNIFFDANGQIKSMNEIVGILNKSFGGLTQQQKLAYSETIFGREQLSAINALAGTTSEEFGALQKVIGDTSAQEVANTKMDNLSGSVEELKGSFETFMIKGGRPFLNGLKSIVDQVTRAVNWFSDLNPVILTYVGYAVAAAGAISLVVGGLLLAQSAISKVKDSFAALNAVMSANPISLVVLAIGALVAGLIWLYNNNEDFRRGVDKLWESFQPVWDNILSKLQEVWGWVRDNVPAIWESVKDAVGNGWKWIEDNVLPGIKIFVLTFYAGLVTIRDFVRDQLIPKLKDIWDEVSPKLESLRQFIEEKIAPAFSTAKDKTTEYGGELDKQFSSDHGAQAHSSSIIGSLMGIVNFITSSVIPSLAEMANSASVQTALFANWFSENAFPAMQNFGQLIMGLVPIFTDAFGRLMGIVQTQGQVVIGAFAFIALAVQDLWGRFGSTLGQLLMIAFGTIRSVAEAGLKALSGTFQIFHSALSGNWSGAWQGVKNIFSAIWSSIVAVAQGVLQTILTIQGRIMAIPMEIIRTIGDTMYKAGATIFGGLLHGMQEKWNEVTRWLQGLNPAQYKGPPARDAKMLEGNGVLIMKGLQNGMASEWENIKTWLASISKEFERFVLYEDGSIGRQVKDAAGNWMGAGQAPKDVQDWAAVKSLQDAGWTEADVSAIAGLINSQGAKAQMAAAAAPAISPAAVPSMAPSRSGGDVNVNFEFHGVDPRDQAGIERMFQTEVLDKITQAARAGVR